MKVPDAVQGKGFLKHLMSIKLFSGMKSKANLEAKPIRKLASGGYFLSATNSDQTSPFLCNARTLHPPFLLVLHILASSERSRIPTKYELSLTLTKNNSDN